MQKNTFFTNNVNSLIKESKSFFFEKLYSGSSSLKRVIYKFLYYLTKIRKNNHISLQFDIILVFEFF
jgi:hypothetical protein